MVASGRGASAGRVLPTGLEKRDASTPTSLAWRTEERLLIFETKGEHLSGNPDTEYKRKVLQALEGAFNAVGTVTLGEAPGSIFQLVFSEHDFSQIGAQLSEQYS